MSSRSELPVNHGTDGSTNESESFLSWLTIFFFGHLALTSRTPEDSTHYEMSVLTVSEIAVDVSRTACHASYSRLIHRFIMGCYQPETSLATSSLRCLISRVRRVATVEWTLPCCDFIYCAAEIAARLIVR